ncbi:antitoxin protein ParD-4 [Glycocaulis alkaliphilus]|uniref:Antitoxin protein ParD-4 n=1 Tax=Glycocaulis alkaliphilus TaxID=1434191 RepID=A0A3T0E8P4_9PROT|nr:type II toxin-antitoxin system ParD family antitoxin [Glycocaulis alkaliphilus]AZU03692.1 antitoxin protein ParD-4 [Glycocaulis alkaliphilus]GGB83240.1 antitoxin protein parD-4 [Glycocaulis alkaliphilus]
MATMNISLPDALKSVVDSQVGSGQYASASDYVRDLIRRDEENRRKRAEFERLIQEGIDSGVSEKSFDEVMADARAEAKRRGYAD